MNGTSKNRSARVKIRSGDGDFTAIEETTEHSDQCLVHWVASWGNGRSGLSNAVIFAYKASRKERG